MRRATLALLLAAAAAAPAPEDEAESLWREYRKLGAGKVDRGAFQRREKILFRLRDLKESGRPYLFKTLGEVRRPDESVLGILFLGPVRDMDHLDAVVAHVAKEREDAVINALTDVLQRSESEQVKQWVLEKGLASRDPSVLAACCWAARPLGTEDTVPKLEKLWPSLARDPKMARCAFEAVHALGVLQRRFGKPILADACASTSVTVRLGCAETLGYTKTPDDATRGRIVAMLHDSEWQVRKALVECAGAAKNEALAGELIDVLEHDERLTCRYAARAALRNIAGRDLDYDATAWREWLRDRAAEVTAKPGGYTFARYYGQQIVSENVCFLIDLSGSMSRGGKGFTRIEVAKKELVRAIEQLDPKTKFNIVAFSDDARAWKRRDGVTASPKNVEAAEEWITATFTPGGQTNTYDALKMAFEQNPDIDTIFLLSDGSPTVSDYESKSGIFGAVYGWNWSRRVTIHTIALSLSDVMKGDNDWGEDFMQGLATSTHGECRIVAKPPD